MTYSAFSSLMFVLLQHFPYLNISVPHRYFCPFSHSNTIFKFFENSQKISKIFYMYLDKMEIHKIHLLTLRAPLQSCWQIKKNNTVPYAVYSLSLWHHILNHPAVDLIC